MKHGSTIKSHGVNTRVWNGDILIRPPRKSSKRIQLQKSLCLHFFGTHKGYYWTLSRQGSTVNIARYSEMLCDKIKTAIRSKRRGLLAVARECPSSHYCPQCWNPSKTNFEVLEHPPYSSNLARLVYHLFGPLKQGWRGCRFITDQQLKETVHAWLVSEPKTFYSEGIKKIVWRQTKCSEK